MNSYRYRVTVDALTDAKGQPVEGRSLTFEAANHDDLLAIVDRVRTRDLGLSRRLNADETAALMIGMKIFSEVALVHRKEPFFADIWEALGRFVGQLKAKPEVVPGRTADGMEELQGG